MEAYPQGKPLTSPEQGPPPLPEHGAWPEGMASTLSTEQEAAPSADVVSERLATDKEWVANGATSVDDFWDKLAQLTERHDMTPQAIGDLYGDWRERFIAARQQEQAKSALNEYGIDPNTEFRPEGIDSLDVWFGKGLVAYDSVDEIIDDIRAYFVPRMDRLDSGVAAADDVATVPVLFGLNPDGGEHSMNTLEQEIRAWAASDGDRPYSAWDIGRLFQGYNVGVACDESGGFRLALRHKNGLSRPERIIDDFAAFVDKEVSYVGGVVLVFKGGPPTEFVKTTDTWTVSTEKGEEMRTQEMIDAPFPAGAVFRHVQSLLKLSEETITKLWQATEETCNGTANENVYDGSVAMSVWNHHSLKHAERSHCGDRLETRTNLSEDGNGSHCLFLPQMNIHIRSVNSASQPALTRALHAVGVMVRASEPKRYPHGSVAGYGLFYPNDKI